MTFLAWMGLAGALLLLMALSSAWLRRLPVTASAVYLALGLAVSPLWLNLMEIDFIHHRTVMEHLTEVAVIISLFIGGLRLRLPLKREAWSAAVRLAGPVMLVCILAVAAFTHLVFGFEWPLALLLGAVLAPTDPVLAGMVSVNDAADRDRMRRALSGEAGLNDGAAFPFVILALMWMEQGGPGGWMGGWALHRLVWAVPAGLLIGYFLGNGAGRLAILLRSRQQGSEAPNDFLALALTVLSYAAAETVGAWGFLAAFAAGVGFRHAEVKTVKNHPVPAAGDSGESPPSAPESPPPAGHPPAEEIAIPSVKEEELKHPSKAAGVVVSEIISFGDTAERLLEVMMVVLTGICLPLYWDWRALPLAFVLFVVIRPSAVFLFLMKSPAGRLQRLLMGWFGIRGIGSLYYLSYALNHGLTEKSRAAEITGITLSIVAVSIVIHGVTSQPFLGFYARKIHAAAPDGDPRNAGDVKV